MAFAGIARVERIFVPSLCRDTPRDFCEKPTTKCVRAEFICRRALRIRKEISALTTRVSAARFIIRYINIIILEFHESGVVAYFYSYSMRVFRNANAK